MGEALDLQPHGVGWEEAPAVVERRGGEEQGR